MHLPQIPLVSQCMHNMRICSKTISVKPLQGLDLKASFDQLVVSYMGACQGSTERLGECLQFKAYFGQFVHGFRLF